MSKIFLLSLVLLSFSQQLLSQDQTKLDAIKSDSIKVYLKLTKQDDLMKTYFESLSTNYLKSKSFYSPEMLEDSVYLKLIEQAYLKMALKQDSLIYNTNYLERITIYAKHFTQNEMNEFLQFYRTPSCQKLINKTPIISTEIAEISIKNRTLMMEESLSNMEIMMEEINKISKLLEQEKKNRGN